ncbi:MAG TPA: amidohydrolase family protein [Spongiibacteraceae bacterium]
MLIRNAEINFATIVDIRISDGRIAEIATNLTPHSDELTIDAKQYALLPGLHDHHLHFLASAAALDSVFCGPPNIADEVALIAALQAKAEQLKNKQRWLRGIGYHESVAGNIDRHWLDRVLPTIPARIQQRSGRLWIFNSCALNLLGDLENSPLEEIDGEYSGRLYDADVWLREKIGHQLPDIRAASTQLARFGVTGITDTSVSNSGATFAQFAELQVRGELLQDVVMMGDASLDAVADTPQLRRGPRKIHLHENELPDFDAMCAAIESSHATARPVAVHCVTLVDLIFTLNAFAAAGTIRGDRIEHAAIAPPEVIAQLKQLQLIVVTQPNFISERGDAYLEDVEPADQPWLYRLQGFIDAGIHLVAGTDAPFGNLNPWLAMHAAVTRCTATGKSIGVNEALNAERALELFLGDPLFPGDGKNLIELGMPGNFCLLDLAWRDARHNLSEVNVLATIKNGRLIWSHSSPDFKLRFSD